MDTCSLLLSADCRMTSAQRLVLQKYVNSTDSRILFHNVVEDDARRLIPFFDELELTKAKPDPTLNIERFATKNSEIVAAVTQDKLTAIPKVQLSSLLNELHIRTSQVTDENGVAQCVAYLFTSNPRVRVEELFQVTAQKNCLTLSAKKIQLHFVENSNGIATENIKESELYVVTKDKSNCSFNWRLYQNTLHTKTIGQNLIYADVIDSTQNLFTNLNVTTIKTHGLVVHARQQTNGKGRSGNKWLSPAGCMMFSVQVNIPLKSNLGRKLPYVQHIAVVAFVKSIKERPGYEELDLNIKWPNDIYIKKKIKIGGVIVNSSLFNSQFNVVIGLGANVSNAVPTECLNSLINDHNTAHGKTLSELCVEDVLAGTLNAMERLINLFQEEGMDALKKEYYQHWLHSNAEVTLESRNNERATMIGLDEFGYLLVKLNDETELSLQPDGNSFDMMRNMIVSKNK